MEGALSGCGARPDGGGRSLEEGAEGSRRVEDRSFSSLPQPPHAMFLRPLFNRCIYPDNTSLQLPPLGQLPGHGLGVPPSPPTPSPLVQIPPFPI